MSAMEHVLLCQSPRPGGSRMLKLEQIQPTHTGDPDTIMSFLFQSQSTFAFNIAGGSNTRGVVTILPEEVTLGEW